MFVVVVVFQAEDGIRDLVRSRGLGDVYKRQGPRFDGGPLGEDRQLVGGGRNSGLPERRTDQDSACLLYTSDAADERSRVDLGGRRSIKKKKHSKRGQQTI